MLPSPAGATATERLALKDGQAPTPPLGCTPLRGLGDEFEVSHAAIQEDASSGCGACGVFRVVR